MQEAEPCAVQLFRDMTPRDKTPDDGEFWKIIESPLRDARTVDFRGGEASVSGLDGISNC
jgi:hypothetical protein